MTPTRAEVSATLPGMSKATTIGTDPAEAEERFRRLLRDGDIDQPDEVEHDPAANELIFFWNDPQVAIVLELDSHEPVEVWPRADLAA